MVTGGVSMLAGLDAALLRLGVWAPFHSDALADVHGPVMVLGFLATVIAVERAQALGASWGYLAPALLGAGGLACASGPGLALGKILLVQGTVAFLALLVALWRRAPTGLVAAQVAAAGMAALAATLWLWVAIPSLIPLLATYLVITIGAERAGMARLATGPRFEALLVALTCLLVAASALSLALPSIGTRFVGAGLITTSVWLIRDDVGRRLVRLAGMQRYNGAALLAGYFWLGVAGTVWLVAGPVLAGGYYDLAVHGIFLGFGISMVLAHAPMIFPAVLNRDLPYSPILWAPLIMLHAGMIVRATGDLSGNTQLWQIGGITQVIALLLTAASIVFLAVRPSVPAVRTTKSPRTPVPP